MSVGEQKKKMLARPLDPVVVVSGEWVTSGSGSQARGRSISPDSRLQITFRLHYGGGRVEGRGKMAIGNRSGADHFCRAAPRRGRTVMCAGLFLRLSLIASFRHQQQQSLW